MPPKAQSAPAIRDEHEDTPSRCSWTTSNVEALLELRYSTVARDRFNACQTNKQKAAWWAWLSARLGVRTEAHFTPKQVKNKFTALKKEYRALIQASNETGNLDDEVKYPDYWTTLSETMQVTIFNKVTIFNTCH